MDSAEKGGKQPRKRLPCRFSIKVSGVEAFMYNRSPAYDGIIAAMERKAGEKADASQANGGPASDSSDSSPHGQTDEKGNRVRHSEDHPEVTRVGAGRSAPKTKPDEPPSFLRLLPVRFECNKGAIVVGNEHTPSVITAQFDKASGEFDASQSGPLDVYQQVFNFQFQHPVVHMKPNPDFKTAQLETAVRVKQEAEQGAEEALDEKHGKRETSTKGRFSGLLRMSSRFSKSTESINMHPKTAAGKK